MTKKVIPVVLLTRRDFLHVLGGSTLAAAMTACGAPTSQNPATTPVAPTTHDPATTPVAPQPAADEPRRGGILRVAFGAAGSKLDPALMTRLEDVHIAMATHDSLVRLDEKLVPQPALAVAWQSDENQQIWTFTLREGVVFHHGTPFTAEDVVFSFERVLNPDTGSPGRGLVSMVDQVEAVDAMTVRFHLTTPIANFPSYTALSWLVIVAHDRSAEQLKAEPSGTGPFRFGEQRAGEQTTVVRNETYWNAPRPYLDELRFLYVPDPTARIEALRSNIVDVIWQIEPEMAASIKEKADLRLIVTPSGEHNALVMDITKPPFDDLRVRQAFKHCVDREGMVKAVLQGYGVVGNDQPVSPDSSSWANIVPMSYDTKRAKELLAEAGYADGLELTLATTDARPGMVPMSVAFQEMARPAGITVNIERYPSETYWSEVFMKTSFFASKWSVFPNTDILLQLGYRSDGPWLETGLKDPELDNLITEVRGVSDPAQQKDLYGRIQELISHDGAAIIPYFKDLLSAAHTHVQGVTMLPTSWMYFDDAWLSQA